MVGLMIDDELSWERLGQWKESGKALVDMAEGRSAPIVLVTKC